MEREYWETNGRGEKREIIKGAKEVEKMRVNGEKRREGRKGIKNLD